MRRAQRQAGFTLLEVIIAAAISMIIVLAVSYIVVSQQKSFGANESLRSMDENLRVASQTLEQAIRGAGVGMDPNLAVDFQYYNCDTAPAAAKTANCTATNPVREGGASAPDELVVYGRDMNYALDIYHSVMKGHVWKVSFSGSDPSTINLTGPAAYNMEAGQILLIVCAGASTTYAYETVSANASLTANAAGAVSLTTTDTTNPFKQRTALGSYDCFSSNSYAYLINRKHFYVGTYSGHPYLMMDTGLANTGTVPIASDIEDFQVSYQFAQWPGPEAAPASASIPDSASPGNSDYVLYDMPGEEGLTKPKDQAQTKACPDIGVPFYASRCFFERGTKDPARFASPPNPAAIVAVGVGLLARSPYPDSTLLTQRTNTAVPALLNRTAFTTTSAPTAYSTEYAITPYGYLRTVAHLSVPTPSLDSRGMYLW